jgi:vacuolar protein 8
VASTESAAAEALGNLADNADNKAAISQAGAIAPLVALLSGGGIDRVKDAAAGALATLAVNADNQVAIARAGAIAPLGAMLSEGGNDRVKYERGRSGAGKPR